MANSFTVELDNAILNHINGVQSLPSFSAPRIVLTTVHGGRTAPGQQVAISGGYTGAQTISFSSASNGRTANTTQVVWDDMPATVLAGYEIWSSNLSLRMIAVALSSGPKALAASSSVVINIGKIALFSS